MAYTDYLPAILIALIPAVVSIVISNVVSYLKQDKKDNIWINVLIRYDPNIKACIEEYKEIENPPMGTWVNLAQFLPIPFAIVIATVALVYDNFFIIIYGLLIISIIYVYIGVRTRQKNEDQSLLKESKQLATWLIFLNFLVFNNTLFTIGGLDLFYLRSHLSITQFLYEYFTFLFFWILVLVGTIYISVFLCRKNLLRYSKDLLNSEHHVNFPCVHIKTNSIELKGRVHDIFDKNLIILENYGETAMKVVKWDSIKYLEIYRVQE